MGSVGSKERDVVSSMFMSASVAMIFTVLVGMIAQFVDGIITSRFLGGQAYSAVSLFGPINGLLVMVATFISVGNQIVASGFIGVGKRGTANSVFTFATLAALVAALVAILLFAVVPDALISFCGITHDENPEIYAEMLNYMRGFAPGIPALILVQIFAPMIILDKGKVFITISALAMCVVDITGDLANVLLIRWGTFGMGLATACAHTSQMLLLLGYLLLRKEGYFRFTLREFTGSVIGSVSKNGSSVLVQNLASNLRDLFVNRINLFFALSSVALVARGVQFDISMILFCTGIGIGNTMSTMTGLYHGSGDRLALRRLFSYGFKFTVGVSASVAMVVIVFAPWIAGIYSSDAETVSLCVFGIRFMAAGLVIDSLGCFYVAYLQGIQNRRFVMFLSIMDRLVLPVGSAVFFGFTMGSRWILAAVFLGRILLAVVVFISVWIMGGVPFRMSSYMLLPKDFGGDAGSNLYGRVSTMKEVVEASESAKAFCIGQGAEMNAALKMALFLEEMAGNIVKHGSSGSSKQRSGAEYRLYANGDDVCLTLRDYNRAFDPTEWHMSHQNRKPEDTTGIGLVMDFAKQIRYFNAFDSNNLIIWLDMRGRGKDAAE